MITAKKNEWNSLGKAMIFIYEFPLNQNNAPSKYDFGVIRASIYSL